MAVESEERGLAVVTGASSGIGAAIATRLAQEGFQLLLGARREERLRPLAEQLAAEWRPLDVSDPQSLGRFCQGLERVSVLVNNAGGARGLDPLAEADAGRWRWMWEVNVMGLVEMTRRLLPALERSGHGHVVNISSTAALEVYEGGAGYTSAKHAVHAISKTLRLELLGSPVRVTEVCPGLVETEFSLNRFEGDSERAEAVYRGMEPLTPEDVADVVAFAVTRPGRVNLDQIVMRPLRQAAAHKLARQA